jgi:hypothetical protein
MANVRRRRTDEEQALYERLTLAKKRRVQLAADLAASVDGLSVSSATHTDFALALVARIIIGIRSDMDACSRLERELEEQYVALRARRAEDIPL